MTDLSPAAKAIFDAAWKGVPAGMRDPQVVRMEQIAASLRALGARTMGADEIKADILDIAAELVRKAEELEYED